MGRFILFVVITAALLMLPKSGVTPTDKDIDIFYSLSNEVLPKEPKTLSEYLDNAKKAGLDPSKYNPFTGKAYPGSDSDSSGSDSSGSDSDTEDSSSKIP